MSDKNCQQFQNTVAEYLVRHRSVLDVISKLQESAAHVNRAIVNSVITCGCLKIDASRQQVPTNASLSDMANYMQTHLKGSLCPICAENLQEEIGDTLFYLTGICALLGLDLDDIIYKENKRLETLGIYNLT